MTLLLPATGRAAVVSATFNAVTDVAVTASGYTATGNTVAFTLNFAPATGTALTVVNNTGAGFIAGTFGNLAQGQRISLAYGGVSYAFVADYFGGTGNDLVLQWADSRLVAWGENAAGQIGNSVTSSSPLPAAVSTGGILAGKTVTQVAAGSFHTLVLCSDGTLYAWGSNSVGQLGNGTTTSGVQPVAVDQTGVLAGKTVVSICSGSSHSLVLCSDGTLVAWGANLGALGNNSTASSSVPVLVTTAGTVLEGKTISALAAGNATSFALCTDGTLAAWGSNYNGQLGINSTTSSLVPVAVATQGTALQDKTVTAIAAGDFHALALCSDGKVVAWGQNFTGQLGNNSTTSSLVAVAVATSGTALQGKTVKAIAAGQFENSLALCTDGTIAAWGDNTFGQLGKGTTPVGSAGGSSSAPVKVTSTGVLASKTVVSLHAGSTFAQALCSDGTVVTWGDDTRGQLGDNRFTTSGVPVLVTTAGTALQGKTVSSAAVGNDHNIALCSDGTLVAWGDNRYNQLGTGGPSGVTVPVAVSATSTLAGKTVVRVATGKMHSLMLCADGTLAACGDNGFGQLGNGGTPYKTEAWPVTTSGALAGKTVVAVAAGDYHSLALCSDGTMAAWGSAAVGQLGNGSFTDSNVPVAVTKTGALAGKTVVAIAAGALHNLALCSDGTLVSWGLNASFQLGGTGGNRNVPGLVSKTGALAGQTVTAIAAGNYHSVVLCSEGTLAGWGRNAYGQLGNGTTTALVATPVAATVTGTALEGRTVSKVIAGSLCTLALCTDGTLAVWGSNSLGTNSTTGNPLAKQLIDPGVLAAKQVQASAAGNYVNVALCTDGTLAAWSTFSTYNGTGISTPAPASVDTSALTAGERFIGAFTFQSSYYAFALVAAPLLPPPVVTTLAATSITATSATLNGSVATTGVSADVAFDLGTSASYGSIVAGSPPQAGAGSTVMVSGMASSLSPATTYHFRVNGTTPSGTAHGDDLTFTTLNNNASLAGLTIATGILSPAFAAATKNYVIAVPLDVTSLTVTPTAADSNATLQAQVDSAGFFTVTSGAAISNLPLISNDPTMVSIKVTAQDGETAQTYSFTVIHASSLQRWKLSYFGSASARTGLTEDFDGDGVSNLKEFAFGTNPADSSSNACPLSYSGNTITPGGNTTEVIGHVPMAEFIRRRDYLSAGLTYTVQFSSKLKVWETSVATPTVLATDGTYDVMGIPFPKLSDGVSAKFFRVTVTAAP